jgi:hypothetical protein
MKEKEGFNFMTLISEERERERERERKRGREREREREIERERESHPLASRASQRRELERHIKGLSWCRSGMLLLLMHC